MLPRSPRGHHSGPTLIFMRAAEATTLPAVDPSDAEEEVVGEAASYLKLFVACCGGGWSATRSRESIAARAVTGHDANSAMTRIAKRRSS